MIHDENSKTIAVLWRMVIDSLGLIVVIGTGVTLLAIAYALLATEQYKAQVLLAPAEDQASSGLAAQFGGLAGLAGIDLAGGNTAEPIAVLTSRGFVRDFIVDRELMPILFADDWDENANKWRGDQEPDMREAVRVFREDILTVREDPKTGLVTVEVEWTDPDVAADWANRLVQRLNRHMRDRALGDARRNIEFLESELAKTSMLTIQQSIGRLLETELQRVMLARGNAEYSFRVLDPAVAPRYRSRPRRTLIAILGVMLGGLLGLTVAWVRYALREAGPQTA